MPADAPTGLLIVNADDWGRDVETTDRILDCVGPGGVSAVSAMVFMEDSERAAAHARERGLDAGLHLNLTSPFSADRVPASLLERQAAISRYLRRHRLTKYLFNPALTAAFAYVVAAQLDEFRRLYGMEPARIDGHHHMHLCANVLVGGLLPARTIVRRNFCFEPGEKSLFNRAYRRVVDKTLSRRHRLTDLFFSLQPMEPRTRVEHICSLARTAVVELETHPVVSSEYQFLRSGDIVRSGVRVGTLSACQAAS
jgi:hypothetical protein